MTKVVIDTNILYSLCNIFFNPKIKRDKLFQYDLAVTTTTLIEVIARHRNCLEHIKGCLKPVVEKEIELINIGYTPLPNEIILKFYNATNTDAVRDEIETILSLKITKEAEV